MPVVATTNRREQLDPAFDRRLGRHILVGLPNEVRMAAALRVNDSR